MSRCHDAGQMLLETQIRFASEPVWIGTECPKKTVYFLLRNLLPCGVSYQYIRRVILLSLHLLLPTTTFMTDPAHSDCGEHLSHPKGLVRPHIFQAKTESQDYFAFLDA